MLGLTLACVILVAQGHIFPKDISMSPNNLNTPSEFTIIFTLDSPLGPSDYLRMVFPFAIGTIQPGVWDIYTNCSIIGPGKKAVITASAIVTGEVSNAFFVQFYSDLTTTTRANLTYNVTYYLQFTATPDALATPGINLPIQLSTVSNNADVATWIRYDSNPVFGTLSLAAAYPTSMTVTSSVPATETGSTDFGADYKVNIDFIPKTTIKGRARIDIQLSTADFELLDCESVSSTTENIALLPATFQPLASNRIRAIISSTLFAGNNAKYRFQCTVQNPLTALTSPIIIQTRPGYQETIIDSGTASPGLSAIAPAYVSPGWDESQHKILLGWGYEASSPTALNIMGLYHDASATEKWYQSAKIIFKPKSDLDVIDKIQVVINTVNNAQFSVLQASIFHNLPDYSSTDKVKCSIVTQGYLTCQNVGQLQGMAYFVSFRFNFGYTTSTTTVPDFGKVLVQTQAATPFTLISVSSTTLTNTGVNANVPLFVSSDGVIATTTTKTSSPVSTPYITNGEDVKLQLKFNYFKGPTFMALTKTDVGIEFYTTNSLASVSQPACTISGFAASDATFTDCGVDQMASYTRLRFRLAVILNQNAGGPPATTFNTNQYGTIVFDPVRFGSSQFTSFNYVNENVFDFYARWVEGFAAVNPAITLLTSSLPFFFTSVVYNYASLSNLQVGAGFFYSGSAAGSTVNDGTEFPTVIRVTGYLTPEEQTTADRLLLFFNDFEPQDITNPCFGPTGITCNYIEGNSALENTDTDARTDYTGSRRIEINTDLTQKFNIYIPVSVPNQIRNFGFFIATASTLNARATDLGIFATQYSKRFAAPANSYSNYNVETVTGAHIALTGTPTIGSAIDTTITGMTAAYIPTANSGTSVGAHYGYCANYDFAVASGFAFQPFYSSSATPEQYCVDLQYTTSTVPAKNMYCYICPVHATMTAGTDVTVTQFTLPTSAGIDFSELSYVMSDSTGELKKATKDQQSALMSPLAPSDHSITFSPTDFKKGSKNVYARFSFTVLSPLPKTVRINVVPFSPSTDLLITPVTSVGCTVNTITTATPCTISGTSTDIQFDITAQDDTWPMMTHTIDFMVDASGAASGISGDAPVDYSYTIKVTGYTTLDVMHHESTAQSYTVKDAASLDMGLTNFNYLLGTQNARTVATFDFEIPSDILAHPNQLVVIDLGGIAAGNTGFKPLCRVLHAETQVVSNDFSKCDLTDLTQVKLTPNGHISGKYTAEFSFLKVPTTTTGITVKVVAVDGTTTIAQSAAALTLPTAPASTALASATYDRLYSNPGSVGEIIITLTSAADIKNTTYLYVYFPTYYADRLGYQNLVCTADDLPLSCFLIKNRLVQLTSFPQDVVAGTSLKVKIYGVITPAISTAGNIFIALGLSESLLTLSEQIEVADKASVATLPAVFSVNTLSLTSNTLRGLADYNISFTTDSVGVRSGNIMTIDLPDSQGSIVRNQTASLIQIYKTGDTLPTEIQSTLFGSRFKFKLTLDFNPKTSYSLVIKNVKTAEQTMCNVDKPTIIVTDTAENAAIRRSASNVWDTPPLNFVEGSSLKTLGWTDSAGNPITSLALTIGVYSPEIRIVPPTGENFNTDITFKNSQNILTIQPSTLKAARGTPYLAMKLAASSSLLPSVILLDLDKSEGFSAAARYSSIFRLPVTLTTVTVTLPAKTISIVKGATSFLYGWELDTLNMIPHTELKIDVAITAPSSTVLSVLGPSSITYSLNSPREGFVFELTSAADPLSPPSFTLSLSGVDSSYYALETPTVTVTVLTPPAAAPIILQALTTASYAPTRQQFSITTDQPSAIYWHVALKDSLSTSDCLRIRSRVDGGQFSDQTSNSQPQYGVFYIPVDNVATLNEIGNLMSNTAYSYILCPANQLDVLGTASTGTFTTADNGATMFEVNLLFSAVITRSQLMSIICVFSKELQLPNENVVAMDGTTCGAMSVFDVFTSFDYKNLTLYIIGDKRTDSAALTKSVLTDYITSVTAQTPSSFQTNFNQTLQTQSLTSLYQTMTLKSGSTYSQPVIPASSTVSTSATDTTITVSGLQLSSGPGVFYGVASTDILAVPSYPQIRNKLNSQGVSTSGANALYTSGTVQLKFTNLKPLTDYIIYYYGANNDRTQYASLTEMKYIRAKTVASATANHASQAQVSLILGFIISAIMLLL